MRSYFRLTTDTLFNFSNLTINKDSFLIYYDDELIGSQKTVEINESYYLIEQDRKFEEKIWARKKMRVKYDFKCIYSNTHAIILCIRWAFGCSIETRARDLAAGFCQRSVPSPPRARNSRCRP